MPTSGNIYYLSYQQEKVDAPPVVLIHGAAGNHLSWPPEVRRMPGFRVYAIDLPGHGKSKAYGGQQNIGDYGERVLGWMEIIGLRRAVFIGHSMGSAIALALAIHHPDHVVGLGLLGAGVRLRVHPTLLESSSSATTYYRALEMLVTWSFSSHAAPRLLNLVGQRMSETRQSVLYGDLMACNEFDVMDRVSEVRQPTLVVCGADDTMTPLRYSKYLASAIHNARLEVIPEAGHMVMLEQPQAVTNVMLSFLQSLSYLPGKGS